MNAPDHSERCYYCKRLIFPKGTAAVIHDPNCERTRDHYYPCMLGTKSLDPKNIVMACRGCNSVKAHHPPEIFEKFLRETTAKSVGDKRLELNRLVFQLAQFGLIAARERIKYLRRQPSFTAATVPAARDQRGRFTKRDLRKPTPTTQPEPVEKVAC